MQKIKPCLWFDGQAEDAARFYVSIFKNSRIGDISYYGDAMPGEKGTVLAVNFELDGQEFMGLNGGPEFTFSEAVSFYVNVESQKELDDLWTKLLAGGGEESMCGWLKDRFGVSWQIVPSVLGPLMQDKDPAKAARVTQALMQMRKIDIAALQRASAQG
jgi:predicted 3-demethylubiquinone-9 3-methyltransferase (glyoxalase superfamily)